MAANTLQFKKLGFHFLPTNDLLIARLRNKLQPSADSATNHNFFPIIDIDLYSAEPWNLLKEDDPWEISNSGEKSSCTRTIYVFTTVKFVGANNKRAARTAGKGTWSGSTGEKNVDGERPGSVIGTRSYFEFKIHKDEVGKIIVPGHWSMHEYKLGGESYKGLDSIPLAKNLALCQITQVVEKSEGIHLSWPKTPFKLRFDKFKELGCFLKKRKQPEPADHEHQQQVGHQEVQKRNKKRKREGPTSSAPRTLITDQDTPDFAMELDDHRAQENRMDHEGGFNDQSSWAVDQNPNNFGDRDSEFAQQWQFELAKNSEKENYQNNLMSPANTPSCSYNYGADDGNSYFGQVGGSFSNALLRPNYSQMTVSENEYLRMENQLRTDIKAPQPQLDPFELANSEEENYQNNSDQLVVLKGPVQIMSRADTPSCTNKYAEDDQVGGWLSNSNRQMMVSENEKQGMENQLGTEIKAQRQLDRNPLNGVDLDELYERVTAPEWDLMIEQMISSREAPPVFNSAGDGYSYYNEGAGKEKVAEVENGPNSNNKLGEVREEVNVGRDDEYKFDVEEIGGSFDDLLEDADQLWGKGWSLEFQQDHSLPPLS